MTLALLLALAALDFTPLDRFFERIAPSLPGGFEVTIVQDGRTLYAKTYGPWTRDRQVFIASASKWLSGAVIMSLVDDGILSLDDRASRYLPYLTGEKKDITLRQLMSHTAGFPGEFPVAHRCLAEPGGTLAQCAEALAAQPLAAPAGTAFIYSGAGMQIAGRVAEVASGQDWATLFRTRLAGPLGLTATDYEYKGPTRNPRISGGGRSTGADYLKFLTMLAQGGVFEGRRVLSANAIAVMLADQTRGVPIRQSPLERAKPGSRYGIGNWVESPGPDGRSPRNSSIGAAGWTPLIDRDRHLIVVLGMQSLFHPFQPHYPEFQRLLLSIVPPTSSPDRK